MRRRFGPRRRTAADERQTCLLHLYQATDAAFAALTVDRLSALYPKLEREDLRGLLLTAQRSRPSPTEEEEK